MRGGRGVCTGRGVPALRGRERDTRAATVVLGTHCSRHHTEMVRFTAFVAVLQKRVGERTPDPCSTKKTRGVLACGHAGLVINKISLHWQRWAAFGPGQPAISAERQRQQTDPPLAGVLPRCT